VVNKVKERKARVKRLPRVVLVGLLVATVVAFEVFLRIAASDKLRIRAYPLIYAPDELLGYRYLPDTEGEICVPSICKTFRINKNGFYGPDFEWEKEEGVFRIAVFGSSVASGIWLDGEENFSMKLQKRFDSAGLKVEIINFAVDGSSRGEQRINRVRKWAAAYSPDLVLLRISLPINSNHSKRSVYKGYVASYSDDPPGQLEYRKEIIDQLESQWLFPAAYNLSYIVRGVSRYYINHFEGGSAEILRTFVEKVNDMDVTIATYSEDISIAALRALRAELAATRSELLIFSYTDAEKFREIAEAGRISYLQLAIPEDPSLTHDDDGHYNEIAQELIAERLFEALRERNGIAPVVDRRAQSAEASGSD
jgi:lysophospholipase L1-like esterase